MRKHDVMGRRYEDQEIMGYQVSMSVETVVIGNQTYGWEPFFEIASEYRSWRERVKPFASFQEIAQAMLQQSYSPRGQIIVLRIERSEPVGVYWAQVRIGKEEFEIRNWEDWNGLQSARGPQ